MLEGVQRELGDSIPVFAQPRVACPLIWVFSLSLFFLSTFPQCSFIFFLGGGIKTWIKLNGTVCCSCNFLFFVTSSMMSQPFFCLCCRCVYNNGPNPWTSY